MKIQKRALNSRHAAALLAAAFVVLVAAPGALADDDSEAHEFTGARKCKSCHEKDPIGNQYAIWLESGHAKALQSLASDQAKTWAKDAGVADPQTDEKCVKCHVTAFGVSEELLGIKYSRDEGVSCESCHGAGRDYRKKAVMMDPDKSRDKGLTEITEKTCTACHNDESPAWDPKRYTLSSGGTSGFDFDQAVEAIAHPVPEDYDPMAEDEAE